MTGCLVPGCTSAPHAKGFCWTHYRRNARYGDPTFSKVRLIEFNGKADSLAGWARSIGIDPTSLKQRMSNWPIALALTTPKGSRVKHCIICDEPFRAIGNRKTCSPAHSRLHDAQVHVQWRAANPSREKIYKERYAERVRRSERRLMHRTGALCVAQRYVITGPPRP